MLLARLAAVTLAAAVPLSVWALAGCDAPRGRVTWDYTAEARPEARVLARAVRAYPNDVQALRAAGGEQIGHFYVAEENTGARDVVGEILEEAARKGGTHVIRIDARSHNEATGIARHGAYSNVERTAVIDSEYYVFRVPPTRWRELPRTLWP